MIASLGNSPYYPEKIDKVLSVGDSFELRGKYWLCLPGNSLYQQSLCLSCLVLLHQFVNFIAMNILQSNLTTLMGII